MAKLYAADASKGGDAFAELAELDKQAAEIAARREKILTSAKAGIKAKIEALIDEANAMGGEPLVLVVGKLAASRALKAKGTGRQGASLNADTVCSICNFKTNPPHDARRHRSQGDHKKPFTAEELTTMGMVKAD